MLVNGTRNVRPSLVNEYSTAMDFDQFDKVSVGTIRNMAPDALGGLILAVTDSNGNISGIDLDGLTGSVACVEKREMTWLGTG
jgi:hypothetical protein